MKKNEIEINEKNIFGVKNSKLCISGTTRLQDYDFVIYADKKQIEFELMVLDDKGSFVLQAKLPPSSKKVKVFIKYANKEKLICSLNNNLIGRFYRKIKSVLKVFFTKCKVLLITIYRGIRFLWREHHFIVPFNMWKKYIKAFIDRIKNGGVDLFYNPFRQDEYLKWLKENTDEPSIESLEYSPLISVLIPVYNIGEKYLTECIESILNQSYNNFEICLVDDHSTKDETIATLKKYESNDKIKIKYRKTNGHISKATNDALKMANGEFIALVDNDDIIAKNALYEVVKV